MNFDFDFLSIFVPFWPPTWAVLAPKTPPKPPRTRPRGGKMEEQIGDFLGSVPDPLPGTILEGFLADFGRILEGFSDDFY